MNQEPRWPAGIALLAVGGLYMALPEYLSIGPRWVVLAIVAVLLAPIIASHRGGYHFLNKLLTFFINGIVTAAMILSLILLVRALAVHKIAAQTLLQSAASLWATNILVFALWYWRLDAGGPHGRDLARGHTEGAFLFPQMTLPGVKVGKDKKPWSPNFVDYLFLAFNTSTALSPADTQALSRWAKLLMMVQSTISLTVIALLAARAVNVL